MYCEHCGTKIEESAQFCQGCGKKVVKNIEGVLPIISINTAIVPDNVFYSTEWRIREFLGLSSSSHFDILIDKKDMYLIKLPSYYWGVLGFFIGLIVLSIIGAAIGSSMGGSHNRKKRQWYRSGWVDSSGKVISQGYKHDISMTIPLEILKKSIVYHENRFTFIYQDKEITLQRSEKELNRFKQYIETYVL